MFSWCASVVTFGVGSATCYGVGLRAGILSKYFIGNTMFLELLRTCSLPVNNTRNLGKTFLEIFLYLYQLSLIN